MVLTVLVVVGCLGFLVGRRYVAQRLDIERIARTQLVPQLEKALGQKVELGHIETDYRSHVVIHDVVIGRDARSPLGALARARTVTLDLDLFSLVLKRNEPTLALQRVTIDAPQLYVRRDINGKINLLSNVPKGTNTTPKLKLTVRARNGRLWFQDDKTRTVRQVPLVLDAQNVGVDANIVSDATAPNAPVSFNVVSPQITIPREGQSLQNVALQGASTLDGKRFEGKLNLDRAPLPTLLAYVPLKGQATLQSGQLSGTVSLAYAGNKLTWRADGQGRNIGGQFAALRDPRNGQPLPVSDAAGRFAVDAKTARLNSLTLRLPTLNSALQLDGAVTLDGKRVDVRARTRRADSTQLLSMLKVSSAAARELGDFRGGPLDADVRITRVGTNLGLSGTASVPDLNWRTIGQRTATPGATPNSSAKLPPGTLSAPQLNANFQVVVRSNDTRAAGTLRLDALNWKGSGTSPQSAQTREASVEFRARVAGQAAQWSAALRLPAFVGRAGGNTASAQLVSATLRNNGSTIGTRFEATGVRATAGANGTLQAASLSGLAQVRSLNGATRVATDLTLRDWSGNTPRAGVVSGASATLQLDEFDIARPRLAGLLRVADANVSRLVVLQNATRSGPLREVGRVDAQLRFANLTPQQPQSAVVKGSFALSRALVRAADQNYELRTINGQASYARGRLRIANARAQTEFGPITADAELTPGSSTPPRFSLTLPQVNLAPARLLAFLPPGLQLPQGATGRLQISPTSPITSETSAPLTLRTSFDLTVPRAIVLTRQSNGQASEARATNAHLRGNGTVTVVLGALNGNQRSATPLRANDGATTASSVTALGSSNALRIAGQVALSAPRIALVSANRPVAGISRSFVVPAALTGTTLLNARAQLAGSFASGVARGEGEWAFERGSVPLPANSSRGTTVVELAEARGRAQVAPGVVSLPRLAANFGGGRLSGHLALRGTSLAGAVLGQDLDLPQLGTLAGNTTVQRGRGWARVALSGTTTQPRAQVQARGSNVVVRVGERALPLDFVQADLDLNPGLNLVPVRRLVAWSRGARLEAAGEVRREGTRYVLDMEAQAEGVRVGEVLQLAGTQSPALRDADADGLLSVSGHVGGPLTSAPGGAPRLAFTGRVALRLARAYGLQVPEATSQGEFTLTPRGPRVRLTNFAARVSGLEGESQVGGEVSVDVPGKAWRVALDAKDISTQRVARAASGSFKQQLGEQLVPLRGALAGRAEVRGRFVIVGSSLTVKPTEGIVRLDSGPLLWRQREVGALHADVDLRGGVAQIQEVSLRGSGPNAAYVNLTGSVPLDGDAPGLDASLVADGGEASLVLATLREVRDFFDGTDGADESSTPASTDPNTSQPKATSTPANPDLMVPGRSNPIASAIGKVLDASLALPGLQGRASGQIRFTGTLREPIADVQALRLLNVSARTPGGDRQPLPSVDVAFLYNTPQRALTIRRADLRLAAASGDEDDDTLLRVQEGGTLIPGGTVSLSARVLNANLSQLAPWVPTLRELDGAPILRGELDQFTLEVSGTTDNPQLSGSIQARSLDYRGYTLDRLRLSNFRIADGELRVRPGDLTVAKGTFQSALGSGVLPWDWSIPGPDRARPLQVEFPLERADFGTLLGIISPAVASADAEDFSGFLRLGGTLNAPLLAGRLSIRNGNLRLNPISLPFDEGLKGLNGTVTLTGDTLQIDADDPLRGEIVPVRELDTEAAGTTGNRPAVQRDPDAAVRRAGAPSPTVLHALWELRGSVQRDPSGELTVQSLASTSRYDLMFTARNAAYERTGFRGVREGIIAAVLRTDDGIGPGAEAARGHQRLTWMVTGKGAKPSRSALDNLRGRGRGDGGQAFSTGALRLREDFASGLDAVLRSRVEAADADTLSTLAVWKDFPATERANLQPRLAFSAFHLDAGAAGAGDLNGRLTLDNQAAAEPRIPTVLRTVALENDATLPSRRARVTPTATAAPAGSAPPDPPNLAPEVAPTPQQGSSTGSSTSGNSVPLTAEAARREALEAQQEALQAAAEAARNNSRTIRVGGTLTFSNAQIYGAPEGATGGAAFELPTGPLLDMQLDLGENVSFSTATLRANLAGSLRLTGTPREPLLIGTLETRSGQARFPGANARLVSGELQVSVFRDPETGTFRVQANIDALARGRAGRYTVEITLKGPLDLSNRQTPNTTTNTQNLSVQVTTDPPLSQDEAFAQILGTVPVDATTDRTSQAYARAVVGLLSAPIFSGIERSLEQVFGLSSISLDYQLDQPINIEIGKALTDRVYLSYRREVTGEHNGESVPYTLRIEFRIKGNLQLGLQTDERERRQITLQKTFRF